MLTLYYDRTYIINLVNIMKCVVFSLPEDIKTSNLHVSEITIPIISFMQPPTVTVQNIIFAGSGMQILQAFIINSRKKSLNFPVNLNYIL